MTNQRLKQARLDRNLTLQEVANSTAIPYRTLQDYELGNRTPNVYTALWLAKFYCSTVEYLWGAGHREQPSDGLN